MSANILKDNISWSLNARHFAKIMIQGHCVGVLNKASSQLAK